MQMIDLMKRLSELDENTPAKDIGAAVVKSEQNISVNESLDECGAMDSMSKPSSPATISITAGDSDQMTDILSTMMALAGVKKTDGDQGLTGADGVASIVEPTDMNDMDDDEEDLSMREIINKVDVNELSMADVKNALATAAGTVGGGLVGGPLGAIAGGTAANLATKPEEEEKPQPTQGTTEETEENTDELELNPGKDETEEGFLGGAGGALAGLTLAGPLGAVLGGGLGASMTDSEEEQQEAVDNTPAKATKIPPKSADALINTGKHNHDPAGGPGAAKGRNLMNHPKARPTPDSTVESLMKEYRDFINEDTSVGTVVEVDQPAGAVDLFKTEEVNDFIEMVAGNLLPKVQQDHGENTKYGVEIVVDEFMKNLADALKSELQNKLSQV